MITTLKGDITGLDFDMIVNPASSSLMPQPGLCSQIFSKAGKGLVDECITLKGCEMTQAKITKAYDLPSHFIVHVAMPVFIDSKEEESELLEACYWNALACAYGFVFAQKRKECTLAFPILGYEQGFDKRKACHIAVNTIQRLFREYPDAKIIHVIFVCDDQENYSYIKEELHYAFHG